MLKEKQNTVAVSGKSWNISFKAHAFPYVLFAIQ